MKTTDILGCAGGAAFLLLAAIWIPFAGPLLSLLTPLPFLYYSTKLGFQQGVKLTILVVLVIALAAKLAGQTQIIILSVEFSLLGLVLSEFFRRKLTIGRTVLLATLFVLVLGLGVMFFLALPKNMGPFDLMLGYLQDHLKAAIKASEGMGVPQGKTMELEEFGKALIDAISRIYPSLLIIGAGFVVWLNIIMVKPLFRMKNLAYPEFVPLDRWQSPDRLIWVVIASGFALFLPSRGITLVAVNALIVMMAIYFFHGLSITLFFLNKYRVPSVIRVAVYLLVVIQQLFAVVLALAGLFDQWADFRKIHRRSDN
ncbi:MAG: DUF2232 domain-containing protein [Deltaproteobacteria bacterium]|nr:DUF2232 domain-containing protein [Deltaproteobacteria bacterium]